MIIDSHTHLFPPGFDGRRDRLADQDPTFAEMYRDPKAYMAVAEDLLAAMDRDGVDLSVVMGIGWTDLGLARESNNYIAEVVARYPDRIVGFGSINPVVAGAIEEIERCVSLGLRGIGELHPHTQDFDVSDTQIMAPLVEALLEFHLPLTVHCSEPLGHDYPGKGSTTPEKILELIKIAKGVDLLLAHWGGGLPFYAMMPEVSKLLSNVYFDTSASPFLYEQRVFRIVSLLVGSERILSASDYPLMNYSRVREQIRLSGLSEAEKLGLLGGNAARVLGLASDK